MTEDERKQYLAEEKANCLPPLAQAPGSGVPLESILIAGQLAGQLVEMSSRLDADALEKWLDSKPEGFRYEKWCRAAIAFKRSIALPPNKEVRHGATNQ